MDAAFEKHGLQVPDLERDLTNYCPVVHVGLRYQEPFEIGASLEALLMYPMLGQSAERAAALRALCAAFAAEQVRSVPEEAEALRKFRPEYFTVSPVEQRKVLHALKTKLRRRMIAALMARPFVGRAKLREAFQLPSNLAALNPTRIAEWVGAYHDIRPKDNLLHRAWRPSLPVLPLCIGLENALPNPMPDDEHRNVDELIKPLDQPLDIQDIVLWRKAVEFSQEALEIVLHEPKIRIPDHEIVRVVWHD